MGFDQKECNNRNREVIACNNRNRGEHVITKQRGMRFDQQECNNRNTGEECKNKSRGECVLTNMNAITET